VVTPTGRLYSENSQPEPSMHAAAYLRAGLAVIPVPAGKKKLDRKGWQNERTTIEDVPRLWRNGENIGVLLGEPSRGVVDVDLDWAEARAVAPYLLPPTRMSGRAGSPGSHRWYRAHRSR